ncbi:MULTISPECIES: nucleotidyltransferase family protein [unclassified Brevundimonas]|uniref:nucleotidyltransferase family protein n=1 Tax=unclassified Brevundimonas TaxID=2622653 RepID=UPI0006F1F4A0|nr:MULTISPECIES: nucleotidyltransferase family protein [unclassified Brevundimonas]KQY92150.1 nucleotidyl transferase [Brevundimonas sp. Root1423]KRA28712.1 nucleotidyl transferase [Brevundimonas sp. Root608]
MVSNQWRACLLPAGSTLQQAIQQLDVAGLQIVIAVDERERLVGTITDGDIRRGLLRGLGLDSPASLILNTSPLVAPPGLSADAINKIMYANKVHQLPVVDETNRVIGLHVWDTLIALAKRPNLMVVMAGGRGVRLRPHTENCPKPLLAVGGKPMLEHIIERASADGFDRFVIAVHYLGHMIEDHFGDGSAWNVHIDYVREDTPLGTGGALSLLERPDSPFLVTNGDVLTDVRYSDILSFHDRNAAAATMAVQSHEWQHPFGVVRTEGVDIVGFEEKPIFKSHVNAGVYALNPDALDCLEYNKHCDMPALFERLQAAGRRTIVYPMHEPWLDVGRPTDLEQARTAHTDA